MPPRPFFQRQDRDKQLELEQWCPAWRTNLSLRSPSPFLGDIYRPAEPSSSRGSPAATLDRDSDQYTDQLSSEKLLFAVNETNTESHKGMGTEGWAVEHSVLNGTSSLDPPLSARVSVEEEQKDSMCQRWQVTPRTPCLPDMTGLTPVWHSLWQHPQTRQNPSTGKGRGHEVPP